MTLKLRIAKHNDFNWINKEYKAINFQAAIAKDDFVCVAEVNEKPVGIGRVQPIDFNSAELGGILIFKEYRGKGYARKIVEFLIKNSKNYTNLYCIPFKHLEEFYTSFGFSIVNCNNNIPKKLTEKLNWCDSTYSNDTLLMLL